MLQATDQIGAAGPLYARAMTQMHNGDATAGLASLDGCLRVSPLATDCLLRLAQFHALAGECTDALKTARRYVSADRSNASSYEVLAEVLMAAGEPLQSVTTALSDELDRTPAPLAKLTRIQNQTYLSIATGSFVAADAALDAWDEVIASSRDEDDHFEPTIVHIELALEEGRKNKARALAEAYLAHRPAWAMSDSNDGSMFSLATLHRVGAITDGDFAARRQAWLDKKKTQPRGGDYGAAPAFTWIAAFAASATSPDEAREALDVLPDYLPLPDPMMRAPEFEEPIGNAYRLAGRNAEAIPFLTLAAKSCVGLGSSFAPIWARLELGEALESTGDQAGACDAYRVVVKRWGATPTSMSARHAAALLRALACPK